MAASASHGDDLHPQVVVEEIEPEATYDLRRRVLRQHLPAPEVEVAYPADREPGSFHLGIRDDDVVVAIASFSVEPAPGREERSAVRLRGMAVDPAVQQRGLGRALLDAARDLLRRDGVELCWANARERALPFYEALGFAAEGDVFTSLGLPHRVVVLDLAAQPLSRGASGRPGAPRSGVAAPSPSPAAGPQPGRP